jgi:3-deoxy-D-manno-octulosonic-acid transferase
MQNCAAVAGSLVQQNGAVQVRDRAELEKALGDLLADEARREQLGRNALRVVHENLGAIDRTVDMIVDHLAASDLYVVPRRTDVV